MSLGDTDLQTQDGADGTPPDGETQSAPDGQSASQSQGLPKEYTPYSKVVPWDEIAEDLRPRVLAGIKKFHGDMSRSAQEASELKKQAQPLKERSEFLERLFQYPEIQEAYRQISDPNRGRAVPKAQEQEHADLSKLTEYGMDGEASKVISGAIQSAIREAMSPLAERVKQLTDHVLDKEVDSQLNSIETRVKDKGLPSPREMISDLEELIAKRKAGIGIEDAYRLATYDKLEDAVRERVKKELAQTSEQTASSLPPKAEGPYNKPGFLDFGPPVSIEQAIRVARAELSQRR